MAYGTKTFIAQQSGAKQIKVFEAETGNLYRIITTTENIMTPPVITGDIMTVGLKCSSGSQLAKYKAPHFGLLSMTSLE